MKITIILRSALLVALLFPSILAFAADRPKNVILFIGDGMSVPQRMTADEFARKANLPLPVMNHLPFQATTRTCSANSLVTDSAAAATAIACGVKTKNGSLGVDPELRPVSSCATVAQKAGKKVGIVSTVTINHATPGGFYAHRKSRGDGYGIGLDLLASGFDYFAGGGLSRHDDRQHAEYRGDIYALAPAAGYAFVKENRARFDALAPKDGKVWYVATPDAMPYAIDTNGWANVPTLAELTAKGIALLENDRGFFLMVEGGKIDYAGHANDAATNLRELLALDDAVKVALEYQKIHADTLVIVTGDHETGGMTMGFAGTGYAFHMDRLVHQTCSAGRLAAILTRRKVETFEEVLPVLRDCFGLLYEAKDRKDPMYLGDEERKILREAFAADLKNARKGLKDDERYDAVKISRLPTAVKSIFSHKCGIAWTSGAHTALPVLTTAKGPSAERFTGFLDNTDIAKILKELVK